MERSESRKQKADAGKRERTRRIFEATPAGNPHAAFSLIEVTSSLGIAAFCLIAIFGLLPTGLNSNSTAIEQTTAASHARAIIADLRATPASSGTSSSYGIAIPQAGASSTISSIFLRDDGTKDGTGNPGQNSHCIATIHFNPPAAGQSTATSVRVLITWPVGGDYVLVNAGQQPRNFSGSLEAFASLNRN